jgi:F-type H+-transporting ATPase subunit a
LSSEQVATETVETQPEGPASRGGRTKWLLILGLAIAVNVVAYILVPPFDKEHPEAACAFPACFINGTLEFPAPHTLWGEHAPADALITFTPSISNTIFTQWIVIAIVLVGSILLIRGSQLVPHRGQNVFEWFYEFLSDFGLGLAGAAAKPYIPLFIAFFLLIVFSNWIGLVPPVGRVELLRAPSSDVNITLGLALVSFLFFEFEGFRKLGVRGYLGKFFPIYEFRNGIGAGLIAMFVGIVELMLEFVKPVTLSMRLFGNIYGGEVALGVITALTLTIIPVALFGLELMLNAIQALIFSVLTLMFIVLAIESHHDEEGHVAEEAIDAIDGEERQLQPAH